MSFFSSLFIILLCLSIHLCSARNSGLFFHKNSAPQIPFSSKGSSEEWKTDGDSILGFSSHMGSQNSAKIEGSRRQARSILEQAASVVDDEAMDSHNSDPQDVKTIDYDPPHSTPPIHHRHINKVF